MKKIIFSLLILILIFSISGCTDNEAKANFDKALETNDLSYCDKLPEWKPSDQHVVTEIVKKDTGFVTSYNRATCYQHIAKAKNDVSICKMIPPEREIINVCILNVAEFNKNPDLCDEFVSENPEIYESYSSICYYNLAIILQDRNLCEFITETGTMKSKTICLNKIPLNNSLQPQKYYL